MAKGLNPVTGNWYQNQKTEKVFQIMSINQDDNTIDIQHFDGNIEEISFEDWFGMDLELAEPTEDWSGAYELEDDEKTDMEL